MTPPFDAQIVKVQEQLYKIIAMQRCLTFLIAVDAPVKPTDENPWLVGTYVHGPTPGGNYLMEIDGDHVNGWDFTGPAFETAGNIEGAMCAGPTGVVKFKE
jgi:hypothetical protein